MKLVYLTNVRLPTGKAHGRQIILMCGAFAAAGVDVELVSPRFVTTGPDPFEHYGIARTFTWKTISAIDFLTRHTNRFTFFLQNLSFTVSAVWYALRSKTDVFYTRSIWLATILSWFQTPVIIEIHTGAVLGLWVKFSGPHLFIVTTTQYLANEIGVRFKMPDRVFAAHSAADIELFDIVSKQTARERLGFSSDARIVMYVGRLETMGMDKGLHDLINAQKKIIESHHAAQLVIVGGPAETAAAYREYIRSCGLTELQATCVGHVSPQDVPVWMAAADILVMPFPDQPHYRWYMSPLKLFEYMAAGRAIITTDLPSVREVVDEHVVCMVPAGSLEQLVRALSGLVDNPELCEQYGRAAREASRTKTWVNRAHAILTAWKSYEQNKK